MEKSILKKAIRKNKSLKVFFATESLMPERFYQNIVFNNSHPDYKTDFNFNEAGFEEIRIYNCKHKLIYYRNNLGTEQAHDYDSQGNEIFFANNKGYWDRSLFDKEGNRIAYKKYNGYYEIIYRNKQGDSFSHTGTLKTKKSIMDKIITEFERLFMLF